MEGIVGYKMTFGELIWTTMQGINVGCVKLSNSPEVKKLGIKFQAVSAYARDTQVPSYERARAILNELGIEMSEEELLDLLAYSRTRLKERNEFFYGENKEIRKKITLRIKPETIAHGLSAYEAERMLNQRVAMLAGDESKFSEYIKTLIIKDMGEYILSSEDIDRRDNRDVK